MSSAKSVWIAKIGYISISVVFCIAGLALLVHPKVEAGTLCAVTGILLAACGVIKLIGYFSKDLYRLAFQHDFAMGIFTMVLGGLFFYLSGTSQKYLLAMLGALIMVDGLLKLQTTMDARRFGIAKWWMIGILSILVSLAGTLLVFFTLHEPGIRIWEIGGAYVLDGLLNLCVGTCAVEVLKKKRDKKKNRGDETL